MVGLLENNMSRDMITKVELKKGHFTPLYEIFYSRYGSNILPKDTITAITAN